MSSAPDWINAGGGMVGLIAMAILIVNGIMWLFLPFVLISKFNEVIRRLKSIEAEAETVARNTRAGGTGATASSTRYSRD